MGTYEIELNTPGVDGYRKQSTILRHFIMNNVLYSCAAEHIIQFSQCSAATDLIDLRRGGRFYSIFFLSSSTNVT